MGFRSSIVWPASPLEGPVCDGLPAGQALPASWPVHRMWMSLKPLVHCLDTLACHAAQERHAVLGVLGSVSRVLELVALAFHVQIRIVRRTYKQDHDSHSAHKRIRHDNLL